MCTPRWIARAQSYPTRPVRFIVPFPAGGSTDVGARAIGEYLSRAFGQQVYIENKSGAGGNIGIEAARQVPLEDLKQGRITQSNRDKIILGRITKFRLRVTAAVLAKYPRSLSGSPLQE
jgi:tripartite-type tricarboxylate transporter receptor subunit TctC